MTQSRTPHDVALEAARKALGVGLYTGRQAAVSDADVAISAYTQSLAEQDDGEAARVPWLTAAHTIITPACRANRGVTGAFQEAVERIRDSYHRYAANPANTAINWRLVLMREEVASPSPGEGK